MKKILFAVFAFFLSSVPIFSQIVNTIRISATKDIFTLEEVLPEAYVLWPSSTQIIYSYKGEDYKTLEGVQSSPADNDRELQPCLLYYTIQLPLEDGEEYESFTIVEQKEELLYEGLYLHHAPLPSPTGYGESYKREYMTYPQTSYPDFQYDYFEESNYWVTYNEIIKRNTLRFSFCPFRYDTVEKNLYLLKDVSLNITLSQTDAIQHVEAEAAPNGRNIYDLTGRRLSAVPQKGMYIQNGKKILKK